MKSDLSGKPIRVPVSVSGGYWTGSSAVVDLLSEHSKCSVVPEEFILFSFGQFFEEVTHPLLSDTPVDRDVFEGNIRRAREFNQPNGLPRLRAIGRRGFGKFGVYPTAFFSRRRGMGERLGESYARATDELLSLVADAAGENDARVGSAIQSSVAAVLDAAIIGAAANVSQEISIGVFDQAVAPPYIPFAVEAVPHMRFINVDRDWRDQYISLRRWAGRLMAVNRKLGVRPWGEAREEMDGSDTLALFLRLRASSDAAKARLADRADVLWIGFEELVLEPQLTTPRILDFLGLDPAGQRVGTAFHPHVSRTRIGKWRHDKVRGTKLERELLVLAEHLGEPGSMTGAHS